MNKGGRYAALPCQLSYTAESIKAQMGNPQDRMEAAARPVIESVGGKLLGSGFSFWGIRCRFHDGDDRVKVLAFALAKLIESDNEPTGSTRMLPPDRLGPSTT